MRPASGEARLRPRSLSAEDETEAGADQLLGIMTDRLCVVSKRPDLFDVSSEREGRSGSRDGPGFPPVQRAHPRLAALINIRVGLQRQPSSR